MRKALFIALLVSAAAPASRAPAQQTPQQTCDLPEHRQFDFWVGQWVVTNKAGKVGGESTVSGILGGCAVFEEWVGGGSGVVGKSLNFYDRATGRWHQTWIGSDGQALYLEGGLDADGRMVLEQRGDERHDRITWTPNPDRTVHQLWEFSTDGGATWSALFDGSYRRKTQEEIDRNS
jgi:hypothetical protein